MIKRPILSKSLANAIFNDQLTATGQLTFESAANSLNVYTASLVPAVGTSLFMQVSGQTDGDSEGDLLEFLQMKKSEAKLSHIGQAVSTLILDRKSN